MNLLEIRQWVVEDSGRYDLIIDTTQYVDNGLNKYINAGQRMLDRMQKTPLETGVNLQPVSSGTRYIAIPDCRIIENVFAIKSSDLSRTELEKKSFAFIREQYFSEDAEQGTPLYYVAGTMRLAPERQMQIGSINLNVDLMNSFIGRPYDYNCVLFSPIVDEDYVIEVVGSFYSAQMSLDEDETYWSIRHPEILVMATQCIMEKFARNTEGVKDWIAAIKMELQGIDNDLAEEDIVGIEELGG